MTNIYCFPGGEGLEAGMGENFFMGENFRSKYFFGLKRAQAKMRKNCKILRKTEKVPFYEFFAENFSQNFAKAVFAKPKATFCPWLVGGDSNGWRTH